MRTLRRFLIGLVLVVGSFAQAGAGLPPQQLYPTAAPLTRAEDLIRVTNQVRQANGLPALKVNSILMSTAQSTASFMAANHMLGHIGDVRGRVMAAGYGSGGSAWATENIMNGVLTAEEIVLQAWSDEVHSIPVSNPIYCDIGAGVAQSDDGQVFYVLHAAYTERKPCGPYIGPGGATLPASAPLPTRPGNTAEPTAPVPQWIVPVRTTEPQIDGSTVHVVQPGQSLWSIAIAYGVKIKDMLEFNRLPQEQQVVFIGQKLKIPLTVTAPAATPLPVESPSAPPTVAVSAAMTPTPETLPIPVTGGSAAPPSREEMVLDGILALTGLGLALVLVGLIFRRRSSP